MAYSQNNNKTKIVFDITRTQAENIGSFFNKLVDVTKTTIFENEYDWPFGITNALVTEQLDVKKIYTDEELLEIERRADTVLGQLYSGYFEKKFDPVEYELRQLSEEDHQDQIDEIVERLTRGIETISGKLSRHVTKKRDKLLEGIDAVATVEDDLKSAYTLVKASRASLKAADDEVLRNLRVVDQTRRKQCCMELLEAVTKVKRARDLQHSLKRAQELGEYGEAILLCAEGFHGLDQLDDLTVSAELRTSVQILYVETLGKLDVALANICSDFNPQKYTKILEGYVLQGADGRQLAEKVLRGFLASIQDGTARVVRALLLTKPKLADMLAASAGSAAEANYMELCRALPVDMLRPCLLQLMEVVFDVLNSYHQMASWHQLAVARQEQLAEQQAMQTGDGGAAAPPDDAWRAQQAMAGFLTAVGEMLQGSRTGVLDFASRRLKDLLDIEGLFKGEDFLQMVAWCQRFAGMGEAFVGGPTELRPQMMAACGRFLASFHSSNLEAMAACLDNELWRDVGAATGAQVAGLCLDRAVWESPFYVHAWGEPGAAPNFQTWALEGNPFRRRSGTQAPKVTIDIADASAVTAPADTLSGDSPPAFSLSHFSLTDTPPAPTSEPVKSKREELVIATAGGVGRDGGEGKEGGAIVTVTSQMMLKYLRNYAHLMRPLLVQAEFIWQGMTQVFDSYLLCCFFMFSNMTLEDVAWRDTGLAPRLRGSLIRILTQEGSAYKAQVEELMRNRPSRNALSLAGAGQLFDKFGYKMESLTDTLERSINRFALSRIFTETNKIVQAALSTDGGGSAPSPTSPTSDAAVVGSSGGHAPLGDRSTAGGDSSAPGTAGAGSGPESGSAPVASVADNGLPNLGLRERVVAVESLVHVANELRVARPAVLSVLSPRSHRVVDLYFTRCVDSVVDLRDCIYRAGAAQMMVGAWGGGSGLAGLISATNYNVREPATRAASWVDSSAKAFALFREQLSMAGLSEPMALEMWPYAVAEAAEDVLTGIAAARRCTLEGRANMGYDMSCLERAIRSVAPPGFRPQLQQVDHYIKAFYLPWPELVQFVQIHLPVYGKDRLVTLVEVTAEFNKVKRQAKNDLLERLEASANTLTN